MEVRDDIRERIRGGALLAPMLGVTDIPFREICAAYGAVLTCTEMVSARGIADDSPLSYRNAAFDARTHPVAIQLVAAEPDDAVYAIQRLRALQPSVFDINAGCPNDRICAAGAGAGLLEDIGNFARVIRAAVRVSPVPVSVKIRAGSLHGHITAARLARAAEDEGAAWITIHARSPEMPYDHPAMPERIAEAKCAVRIPVIGNGDIFSARDARRMMRDTGCDAVMVARGSLGTPWIFRAIRDGHDSESFEELPPIDDVLALVTAHMHSLQKEYGPVNAVQRMRKHALWYARHYEGVEQLRHQLFSSDDSAEIASYIDAHFGAHPAALAPDDPQRLEREQRFRKRVLYWTTSVRAVNG